MKPYQVSLQAATKTRPDSRTCYHYTIASAFAKDTTQAKQAACALAELDGLLDPVPYAVVKGYR